MKEKLGNLKKKIFNQDNSVNGGKRVMNLNRLLSEKTFLIIGCVAQDLFILLVSQYIFNLLLNIPDWLKDLEHPWNYIGLRNLFPRIHNLIKIPLFSLAFYLFLFIAMAILDAIYIYRTKVSFGENTLNIDQRGEARWTTNEEIKAQYKCIPDCETPTAKNEFDGPGGTIVSRIGRNLYIDPSPTNNLIIGITRSGKGEMFVFPSIDVYSRAKEKTSLVITDPKLELFKSSKETLINRGYDVYLLNLDDPLHSMGFNPLEKIKEAYLRKDYSDAELLAQSFSFSVFNDPTNPDPFFPESAASLLTALIIAHVQDCIEMDEKINNERLTVYNKKRNRFDSLSDERKEKVRAELAAYMKAHPEIDPITDHGLECAFLPEDVEFVYTRENEQKINMYSIINTFTELSRQKLEGSQDLSKLDAYFSSRPELDRAKLKYAAIQLIKYLNLKGYKACYVQLNNHAWVENMINDYAEVEQDVEIGKATYKSVDMFYRIDKLPEILKLDYDYFIYDYGVYWDVDFNKTSFLEKDLMLFCLGAKPGEFDKSYKVIENNFYQAATYIFIFVPEDEEEKKDIYELMAEKKEATFFAPDCRDPFVYTGSEIYEKILPVESIIEEETPKKKRRLFGRR